MAAAPPGEGSDVIIRDHFRIIQPLLSLFEKMKLLKKMEQDQVEINGRDRHKEAVDPVEYAAMTGNESAGIFYVASTLDK